MASLNHIPDPEDPEIAAQATLQGMRSQLTRRINAHAHPSRLINQIAFAELRCVEVIKVLGRLIARAPKVLWVIRDELRKEFEIDPDTLLFTVPKPPAEPQKVDSLTDRALLSLALPAVPINLNQFTALSVKGDPTRQLPYTPLQVLQRVIAMKLQDRIAWSARLIGTRCSPVPRKHAGGIGQSCTPNSSLTGLLWRSNWTSCRVPGWLCFRP